MLVDVRGFFPIKFPPFLTKLLRLVKLALRLGISWALALPFASDDMLKLDKARAKIPVPEAEALVGREMEPASAVSLNAVIEDEAGEFRDTSIDDGVLRGVEEAEEVVSDV